MNMITDFMEKAKGLAKNPLGLIALFISLIYGFACLVLSTSLNNLRGQQERLPLIWFIIGFPILILITFIYLVVNHHQKLYAPSDFRDEENFIKTIDSKTQTRRIQKDVENIVDDIKEEQKSDQTKGSPLEIQTTPENLKEIKNAYILGEEFSLRAFEEDKGILVKRQARFATKTNKTYEFDGLALDLPNVVYGIEVKYTKLRHLSTRLKDRISAFVDDYDTNYHNLQFGPEFKAVLIVVCESDNVSSLKKELTTLINQYRYKPELIIHNIYDLQKRFGFDVK